MYIIHIYVYFSLRIPDHALFGIPLGYRILKSYGVRFDNNALIPFIEKNAFC